MFRNMRSEQPAVDVVSATRRETGDDGQRLAGKIRRLHLAGGHQDSQTRGR